MRHPSPRPRRSARAQTRPTRAAAVVALLSALAVAPTLSAPALASPASSTTPVTSAEEAPGRLLLMLDASGSMNEKDPGGSTKMVAAKKALTGLVGSLPEDTEVGLRVYGATQPGGKPTPKACADTQLVAPIAPLDKDKLTEQINAFEAKGETPIAHSLEKALGDLGSTGKRSVILVSDGEESCVPDPCPVVRKLVGQGIDLQIDTVGFGVGAKARTQLQCIAEAGGGSYFDAKDATALAAALPKVTTRALRSFQATGKPIKGTTDPVEAPALTPGTWSDSLVDDGDPIYYRVRFAEGSTLHANVAIRPQPAGTTADVDRIRQRLVLPDKLETKCAESTSYRFDVFNFASVVSDTITFSPDPEEFKGESWPERIGCEGVTELLLEVTREVNGKDVPPTPAEITLIEEPAVTARDGLPDPLPQSEWETTEPATFSSPVKPVVGGGSFSDAAAVETGTWSDTTMVGEELFYKVKLDWGQSASVKVQVPAGGSGFESSGNFTTRIRSFAADRSSHNAVSMSEQRSALVYNGDTKVRTIDRVLPQVRYRNRELPPGGDRTLLGDSSTAGWYYISVLTGTQSSPQDASRQVIPIRLAVKVSGTPEGAPQYGQAAQSAPPSEGASEGSAQETADAARTEASSPPPGDGSGMAWWQLLGGGLVGSAALGGIIYLLVRLRAGAGP